MPLLLPFKRAGIHERVFQATIYPGIALLACLILAPFALMGALSFGDPTDWWAGRRWPNLTYLVNPKRLYVYYLTIRYDYWPSMTGFNDFYGVEVSDVDTILGMKEAPRLSGNWQQRAQDALACLKERMPWTHLQVLFTGWGYFKIEIPFTAYTGLGEEAWKKYLKRKYRTIATVNEKFQSEFLTFAHVQVPETPNPNLRQRYPLDDTWLMEYRNFLEHAVRPAWRLAQPSARFYRAYLQSLPEIGTELSRLNAQMGTTYTSWQDVHLPESVPAEAAQRRSWEKYVREVINPYFLEIKATEGVVAKFRKFLLQRHGTENKVVAVYGVPRDRVSLPATAHEITASSAFDDWDAFVRIAPLESLRVYSSEVIWQRYLKEKYQTLEALHVAHGTALRRFEDTPWPQPAIDRLDWEEHKVAYLGEMVFKNYRRAWNFIVIASPALWNTARFTLLFTLLSLFINTTAGYALSRFALGPGQMVLIGFLALAAFPIEAIAVPNFILLRDLGLLNTVWALVLPTAVNGYYIYLMKSVFDSIPKSYLEQAQVEGADDWALFWKVSLPFARPMLAVVSLYAFLFSYSNFIWALIVCQQRSQWTLPVFIFNVNSMEAAGPLLGALMALATLPPLVVFVFAHRTLQRSLALPRTYG